MARPDFDKYDLSSFQMKFSTSAPFHGELKADVLARWPGGLVEFYGMTEGGGSCMLVAHQHPDKLHTVGHPLDGHDMRVIDEDGNELPRGEIRSEEHTSELQSRPHLVCRLLLEKKKNTEKNSKSDKTNNHT